MQFKQCRLRPLPRHSKPFDIICHLLKGYVVVMGIPIGACIEGITPEWIIEVVWRGWFGKFIFLKGGPGEWNYRRKQGAQGEKFNKFAAIH